MSEMKQHDSVVGTGRVTAAIPAIVALGSRAVLLHSSRACNLMLSATDNRPKSSRKQSRKQSHMQHCDHMPTVGSIRSTYRKPFHWLHTLTATTSTTATATTATVTFCFPSSSSSNSSTIAAASAAAFAAACVYSFTAAAAAAAVAAAVVAAAITSFHDTEQCSVSVDALNDEPYTSL
eukprot:10982-Heterococcus_DN1.PRE.1